MGARIKCVQFMVANYELTNSLSTNKNQAPIWSLVALKDKYSDNTQITIAPSVDKGWIVKWITVVGHGWLGRTKNEYSWTWFMVATRHPLLILRPPTPPQSQLFSIMIKTIEKDVSLLCSISKPYIQPNGKLLTWHWCRMLEQRETWLIQWF